MTRRYADTDLTTRYAVQPSGAQVRGHYHRECRNYLGPAEGRGSCSRRCCPVDGDRTACSEGRVIRAVSSCVDK